MAEFGGRVPEKLLGLPHSHSLIPSLAFRHPPPNSARFSYATEGALFISAQLSTDENSKHWFFDILPSTTAVFSYATGSRKLSANEQFFVGVQTVVSLLQTTQIISDACFILAMLFTPAQIKPKSFEWRRNTFFFFLMFSCSCACLGARCLGPLFPAPSYKLCQIWLLK